MVFILVILFFSSFLTIILSQNETSLDIKEVLSKPQESIQVVVTGYENVASIGNDTIYMSTKIPSNIFALCFSTKPVKWEFTPFTESIPKNILETTNVNRVNGTTKFIYIASFFGLFLVEDFVLIANCFEIENPLVFKRIFVFSNNLNQIYIFQRPFLYSGNIIPCIATSPFAKIKLFKINEDKSEEIEGVQNVIGYHQLQNGTNIPKGNYICVSSNNNVSWSNNETTGIKAFPNVNEISTFLGTRLRFSCESLGREKLSLNYRWLNHFGYVITEVTSDEEIFKSFYITIQNIQDVQNQDPFEYPKLLVSCHTIASPVVQNKDWVITIYEKPKLVVNYESGVSACLLETSRSQRDFQSVSFDSLKLHAIYCDANSESCIKECVGQKNNNVIFPADGTKSGFELKTEDCFPDRKGKDFPKCRENDTSCVGFSTEHKNGILHCSWHGLIVSQSYFYGVIGENKIVDWRTAFHDDLIQLIVPSIVYQENENKTAIKYEITCKASFFLFAKTLFLVLNYENNTESKYILDTVIQDKNIPKNIIAETVNIVIPENVVSISCHAPWRNSSGFYSTTVNFDIRNREPPEFINFETNYTFVPESIGNFLKCSVEGPPKTDSNFRWSFNGEEIKEPFKIIQAWKDDIILEFPKFSKNLEGVYICEASNEFGKIQKSFFVKTFENKSSRGLIIGISIFSVITILSFLVFFLIKYNRIKKERDILNCEIEDFFNGNSNIENNEDQDVINLDRAYDKEKFEADSENLKLDFTSVLGFGYYGIVIRGQYFGQEIAVKTTKNNAPIEAFRALLSELKILCQIGDHENIIRCLGASTENIRQKIVYILVELCSLGSLDKYLKNNRDNFQNLLSDMKPKEDSEKLDTFHLANWSEQIANGMIYLSSKKVIHGDLAARNVLLYSKNLVKITDFGLARHLYNKTIYVKKGIQALPWPWLALESLKDSTFSTESDIWAYGVTIWEIFTLGQVPFGGFKFTPEFITGIECGMRLQQPQYSNDEIFSEISKCWRNNPNDRPKFFEMKNFFGKIMKEVTTETSAVESIPGYTNI